VKKIFWAFDNKRDHRVWLAMGSSLLAKGGGIMLQIIAMPMLIRSLGVEKFAVFSLVSSVLVFMAFAQFGIGSYLTNQIANRLPANDYDGIRQLTWTAIGVVGIAAIVMGLALIVFSYFGGLGWLWGGVYLQNKTVLDWGVYFLIVVGTLTLVSNTLAGCQAGYQELHISNIYSGAGNFLAGLGIFAVIVAAMPDERWFWAILYGVPLLLLCINACHVLVRHVELRYEAGSFNFLLIPVLIKAGGGFFVVQSLLPLLQREGAKVVLAHGGDMAEVAKLIVVLQLTTIGGGIVSMFIIPLYGAIADATARKDLQWIKLRLSQIRLIFFCIGIILSLLTFFFGSKLVGLWLGNTIVFSRFECMIYVGYLLTATSTYINQMFLLAQSHLRVGVFASLAEILLLLCFFVYAGQLASVWLVAGMAVIQLLSSLPITIWGLKKALG